MIALETEHTFFLEGPWIQNSSHKKKKADFALF